MVVKVERRDIFSVEIPSKGFQGPSVRSVPEMGPRVPVKGSLVPVKGSQVPVPGAQGSNPRVPGGQGPTFTVVCKVF